MTGGILLRRNGKWEVKDSQSADEIQAEGHTHLNSAVSMLVFSMITPVNC